MKAESKEMKQKVALLIPTLSCGGAERIFSYLSMYLSQEYDVYLIIYTKENIFYDYGGKLIDMKLKIGQGIIENFICTLKALLMLNKIKRVHGFNCVMSTMDNANIINLLSRKKEKIILRVASCKSKQKDNIYDCIYHLLIRLLYNRGNSIIAISNGVRDDLINNFNIMENKIKVIYNACDQAYINKLMVERLENKYDNFFANPVVINVGRLTYAKGQWHLIRAFGEVKKKVKNAKLVIIGEGELRNMLNMLVKGLDLEDDVLFLGAQKNPYKYMSKSTVAVFSSLYEGFMNTILEAMNCKMPVISTDCKSGPREIISKELKCEVNISDIIYSEYGILTPVCDGIMYNENDILSHSEKLLARAIEQVLCSEELRNKYGEAAAYRSRQINIDRMINEYSSICILKDRGEEN